MNDLTKSLARFDAWFANDLLDRPPVTFMRVCRNDVPPPPDPDCSVPGYLTDGAVRLALFEQTLPLRAFPGDSFPMFCPGIAADHNGTLFGLTLGSNAASVWAEHFVKNIRDVPNLPFSFDNPYWQSIRQATDLSLERGRGRWITTFCCHGGLNADILVALRGPENLCLDIMDDPEGVRLAANYLAGFHAQVCRDMHSRIMAHGGLVTSDGELSRLRAGRMGCDFLCLISAEMARRTVYESIESNLNDLEQSYFHLDSEGSLCHLDFILSQPKIAAVQWVYGANRGPAAKWAEVYQRLQNSGKAIEILLDDVADALALMKHLKPEGAWFKFYGWTTEADAAFFLNEVGKRSNWR